MGTWVLQTETKGTGATMVPIERAEKRGSAREPVFVPRDPAPRRSAPDPAPAAPRAPRRFRVVDVRSRQVLVDDAPTAETVRALMDVRSTVDVTVQVWDPTASRWRPLTLAEQRAMFELSRQLSGSGRPAAASDHSS